MKVTRWEYAWRPVLVRLVLVALRMPRGLVRTTLWRLAVLLEGRVALDRPRSPTGLNRGAIGKPATGRLSAPFSLAGDWSSASSRMGGARDQSERNRPSQGDIRPPVRRERSRPGDEG